MAVNLATKYSGKLAEKYAKESFTAGNASKEFDWAGVRSVSVYSALTVESGNYDRTASADRFGTTLEVQDEVQEMELTQDTGFSRAIDRGNKVDQMNVKRAGRYLKQQIREKESPKIDKYNLARWIDKAGKVAGISAPTKSTVIGLIKAGMNELDNKLVPDENRYLYIPVTYCGYVELSDEFQKVESMLGQVLQKGYKGKVFGAKVIKVPDSYFPTNAYFLIAHKSAVLAPNKIKTMRILDNVKGIDGDVMEGRNYYDAFVLGAKADGVYAAVLSTAITGAPVITAAGGAITEGDATTIYYTTDGSDPRYSKTRKTITSGNAPSDHANGLVVKAYAERTGYYPSAVTTQTLSS